MAGGRHIRSDVVLNIRGAPGYRVPEYSGLDAGRCCRASAVYSPVRSLTRPARTLTGGGCARGIFKLEVLMIEELEALKKYALSIQQCVLKWPHRGSRPPVAWRRYRLAYSVRQRLALFIDAGLVEEAQRSLFDRLLEMAQTEERRQWAAWREYKRCVESQYLSGRRKRAPRWCCC